MVTTESAIDESVICNQDRRETIFFFWQTNTGEMRLPRAQLRRDEVVVLTSLLMNGRTRLTQKDESGQGLLMYWNGQSCCRD